MKILLAGFFLTLSCAPKVLILQAPIVSMVESHSGSIKNHVEGMNISEKWCGDDKPVVLNNDGSKHYGLIDQVIHKAHKVSKAKFFLDSRFYVQQGCVYMEAKATK